jgi:hypothetical protein
MQMKNFYDTFKIAVEQRNNDFQKNSRGIVMNTPQGGTEKSPGLFPFYRG